MGKNDPTDADLVAKVLAGDKEAFGRLYDRHIALVRAVVCCATLKHDMNDDLTQDCFLRAYASLPRLRNADRFGPWIAGIAREVARQRIRSLRRDRHQFVGVLEVETPSAASTLDGIQTTEEIELMIRRLGELPQRERLAIHAFFLNGRNAHQAANLLGLSRSGVYALLERGLTRLAALIHGRSAKKETE